VAEYREGSTKRAGFPLPDVEWPPTAPFWDGAAQHELRIPFCDACGAANWYPHDRCEACGGEAFTWRVMSGRGRLFSWVVVHRPFLPQYAGDVPFVPALVELDDAPEVRVPTRLVDCDPEALAFDQPVRVVFRPLRFTGVDGEVIAPFFAPA
jgi:uncharacterized OB-fold protein